jgi:predicted nucleic-acid-binding Zn-ribbon protein
MSSYALELFSCPTCGNYPIQRVVKLPPPEDEPRCPKCGGLSVFEKVYSCDSEGHVLE